ncbi:hypothetical protein P7K49_009557 [Saguinus oedipus]|uniref:Nucleolar protein 4 n=1 Tax=Saguinus oedipus TaxID=9490 RepID=A0ABQ9VKA4_SAGOE|nr:hypothetical protein P7K49_009557 [Saguinus oedipus]
MERGPGAGHCALAAPALPAAAGAAAPAPPGAGPGGGWARRAGAGGRGGGQRRRLRGSNRWDPAAWWRRAREEEEEEEPRQREPEQEQEQEQDEPRKLTATAAARAQARSRSPRSGPLPASRLPRPPAGRPAPSAPPGPELPPSLLHPGRGEEEAEQEASRSRRRQRRRRRPSRTERAAAPRVRPPPAPIQQQRRSHTAGQPRPRRAPARPSTAQSSPGTGRPGGRPAPEGAGSDGRMPKPTLLLRGGWERERSPGDSELGRQFRDWCLRTYGDSAKTKTVTRSKYQRIAEVLQGGGGTGAGSGPAAGEKGKFQFWVRSKGFRLGSGREPKMGQVVYVPVKTGSVHASLLTGPLRLAWAALRVRGVPAPLRAAARAVAVPGGLSRAAHPSMFRPPVPSPRQQAAALEPEPPPARPGAACPGRLALPPPGRLGGVYVCVCGGWCRRVGGREVGAAAGRGVRWASQRQGRGPAWALSPRPHPELARGGAAGSAAWRRSSLPRVGGASPRPPGPLVPPSLGQGRPDLSIPSPPPSPRAGPVQAG